MRAGTTVANLLTPRQAADVRRRRLVALRRRAEVAAAAMAAVSSAATIAHCYESGTRIPGVSRLRARQLIRANARRALYLSIVVQRITRRFLNG